MVILKGEKREMIVNPENYFYLKSGEILKDVPELLNAMNTMTHDIFAHHFNFEKNDFYNWVYYVIKDNILAKRILSAKTQKEMASAIENRLKSINKTLTKKETKRSLLTQIKDIHSNG